MIESFHSILPSGAERVMLAAGGVLGAGFSFAFGENVGPLLIWLAIFVVADFVSGMGAAWATSTWKTDRVFFGVLKKIVIFSVVALAHGLDEVFAPIVGIAFLQSITICAYAAGEFGSIIENLERAGLGGAVPPVLRRLVKTLDERIEAHADAQLEKRGLKKGDKEKGNA